MNSSHNQVFETVDTVIKQLHAAGFVCRKLRLRRNVNAIQPIERKCFELFDFRVTVGPVSIFFYRLGGRRIIPIKKYTTLNLDDILRQIDSISQNSFG